MYFLSLFAIYFIHYFQNFLVTDYLRQVNQKHISSRNYFRIFVLRWVFKLIKNSFITVKKQIMLTNFTLIMYKIGAMYMSGAIPVLTYFYLSYLLTQLIYTRTNSPQKVFFLFRKHGTCQFFFQFVFTRYIST